MSAAGQILAKGSIKYTFTRLVVALNIIQFLTKPIFDKNWCKKYGNVCCTVLYRKSVLIFCTENQNHIRVAANESTCGRTNFIIDHV